MKVSKKTLLILLTALVLLAAGTAIFLQKGNSPAPAEEQPVTAMGFESSVILDDPKSLQEKYEEMKKKAKEGRMRVNMKTAALSSDGKKFSCYLANSDANRYNCYLIITLDETGEELYRTDLIPLGGHIETFESSVELSPGTHTATVTFVQVEEDLSTVHAKVNVGLELQVAEK